MSYGAYKPIRHMVPSSSSTTTLCGTRITFGNWLKATRHYVLTTCKKCRAVVDQERQKLECSHCGADDHEGCLNGEECQGEGGGGCNV